MAILAAPAAAQQGVYSWTWSEVTTATGQPSTLSPGVVEPGESVRLSLSLNITPGIGQSLGAMSEFIVAGWFASQFTVRSVGAFDGAVSPPVVPPSWGIIPFLTSTLLPPGAPMPVNETITLGLLFALPPVPPAPAASPNPVLSFVWTPASYTPRSVSFENRIEVTGQTGWDFWWLYNTSNSQLVSATTTSNNALGNPSTGPIPLIPAPATLPALAALALLAARRRRG